MDFRVDNSNAQPLASGRDSGQQGTAAHAGSGGGVWRGADVKVVDDAVDLLTDAAEEISFSHSEQVESRKLEERDIEEPAEPELHSVEAILAYLEAAGHDHPDERLRRFVDELKRKAHEGRDGDPREEARRSFGGVTEQFLALSFAARELAESPEHAALHEQVRTALQALQEESGAHICADLNTIGVAGQFGQGDATRTAAFQSTYRDAVLGGQDLTSMLKGALDRFGESDYRAAVQHLIRALGDDLGAMRGSSMEPARLNAVLQDLYSMEVLATLLEGCQKLIDSMTRVHGLSTPGAGTLLQDLSGASGERWISPGRFDAIADKFGAAEPPARIAFLATVRSLVRDLPLKIFADTDARTNVLDAAQGALDSAIALEEES